MFERVVVIDFQLEMYQNNIFYYFLKIIFHISILK